MRDGNELVLVEAGIAWERRLRPELASVKLRKHSWSDPELERVVAARAESPCILVCDANSLSLAARLLRARQVRCPAGCSVAVLPRELLLTQRALRAAGAIWVQTDWRCWDNLSALLRRAWQQQDPREVAWDQRIWQLLPWTEHGRDEV